MSDPLLPLQQRRVLSDAMLPLQERRFLLLFGPKLGRALPRGMRYDVCCSLVHEHHEMQNCCYCMPLHCLTLAFLADLRS